MKEALLQAHRRESRHVWEWETEPSEKAKAKRKKLYTYNILTNTIRDIQYWTQTLCSMVKQVLLNVILKFEQIIAP